MTDALAKATGTLRFTDDLKLPGLRAIPVEPEALPSVPEAAPEKGLSAPAPVAASTVRVRGAYRVPSAASGRLELPVRICQWTGGKSLTVWTSAGGAPGLAARLSQGLGIPADDVRINPGPPGGAGTEPVGAWEIECARLARQAGAPVKVRLDPRAAASRENPATLIEIEVEAMADGKLIAPLPDHGPFLASLALEDLADGLGLDPIEVLLLNFPASRERLEAADRLFNWRRRWHPRGDAGRGPLRRGFGLSIHPEGVHMADVSVDAGTGAVRVQKVAAVGNAVDRAGLVQGISQALFEEVSAGFSDIGELLIQGDGEGVSTESTVLSTLAALSNAVTNALGVRVPDLPFTPDRVLDALGGKI